MAAFRKSWLTPSGTGRARGYWASTEREIAGRHVANQRCEVRHGPCPPAAFLYRWMELCSYPSVAS